MNRKFIGHLPARTLHISPWSIAAASLLIGGLRGFVLGVQDLLWAATVGAVNTTIRYKNMDASLLPLTYVAWPFPIMKLLIGFLFTIASIVLASCLYSKQTKSGRGG